MMGIALFNVGFLSCLFLLARISGCRADDELCGAWNRMVLDGSSYTSAEAAARRVEQFVRPNSTVIDVGGHLGRFAEAIYRSGKQPRSIFIFEPLRLLHLCQIKRLGRIVNQFGSPQFKFFNYALGNADNSVESIKVAPGKWTSSVLPQGWNTILDADPVLDAPDSDLPNWKDVMRRESIVVRTLSNILDETASHMYEDISVIKIDTEGYEGEVLRGALPLLKRISQNANKILPVMVIETGWGIERHPHKEKNLETFQQLVNLGYCNIPLPRQQTMDVLWVPREVDPSCSKHKLWEGGRL